MVKTLFQDTPFWKKQGRWARPSAASRGAPAPSAGPAVAAPGPAMEEPWFNPHHGVHYPMQPSLQSTVSSWQHHQGGVSLSIIFLMQGGDSALSQLARN